LNAKKMASLKDFIAMIEKWRSMKKNATTSELVQKIIEDSGYRAYLNDGRQESENRIENLNELVSVARSFDNEGQKGIAELLESAALFQESDEYDSSQDALHLMTLHTVKGLEFDTVFITGLEEGIFPHTKANSQEEMEEERRLCYVGITRARKKLFLTFAKQRMLWGATLANAPSRFLFDIPEMLIEFYDHSGEKEWSAERILIDE